MPHQFDATLKGMLEVSPIDWPRLAGLPADRAEVIGADVSTYTGGADKVLRLGGPADGLMHLEFQAGPDRSLPRRSCVYNCLLEDRHDLPVHSVIILLRPRADLSNLTGVYERGFAGRETYLRFRYQVIRVWQLPVEGLLTGGLSTLPLAPIGAVKKAELPGVIGRMQERLGRGSPGNELWTAVKVLMGLRYPEAMVEQLLSRVKGMEESVTYQAIVRKGVEKGRIEGRAEGRAEVARELLLRLGEQAFGPPDERVRTAVNAMADAARLEQLVLKLRDVHSWDELLTPPNPPTRRRRKT